MENVGRAPSASSTAAGWNSIRKLATALGEPILHNVPRHGIDFAGIKLDDPLFDLLPPGGLNPFWCLGLQALDEPARERSALLFGDLQRLVQQLLDVGRHLEILPVVETHSGGSAPRAGQVDAHGSEAKSGLGDSCTSDVGW